MLMLFSTYVPSRLPYVPSDVSTISTIAHDDAMSFFDFDSYDSPSYKSYCNEDVGAADNDELSDFDDLICNSHRSQSQDSQIQIEFEQFAVDVNLDGEDDTMTQQNDVAHGHNQQQLPMEKYAWSERSQIEPQKRIIIAPEWCKYIRILFFHATFTTLPRVLSPDNFGEEAWNYLVCVFTKRILITTEKWPLLSHLLLQEAFIAEKRNFDSIVSKLVPNDDTSCGTLISRLLSCFTAHIACAINQTIGIRSTNVKEWYRPWWSPECSVFGKRTETPKTGLWANNDTWRNRRGSAVRREKRRYVKHRIETETILTDWYRKAWLPLLEEDDC